MFLPTDPLRPPVPERFQRHMAMHELINILQSMYKDTPSEQVLKALILAQQAQGEQRASEIGYQNQELLEALKNIKQLPHAQVTWLLYYRAQELE